jgi:hypothetical protein
MTKRRGKNTKLLLSDEVIIQDHCEGEFFKGGDQRTKNGSDQVFDIEFWMIEVFWIASFFREYWKTRRGQLMLPRYVQTRLIQGVASRFEFIECDVRCLGWRVDSTLLARSPAIHDHGCPRFWRISWDRAKSGIVQRALTKGSGMIEMILV